MQILWIHSLNGNVLHSYIDKYETGAPLLKDQVGSTGKIQVKGPRGPMSKIWWSWHTSMETATLGIMLDLLDYPRKPLWEAHGIAQHLDLSFKQSGDMVAPEQPQL